MGVFFTPNQRDTPARVRCFERAFRHLARSGESVLGTPEGQVVPGPEVGRFNRGVFHLATLLQIPIQPLYLAFPPGRSAGRGYAPVSPEVDVISCRRSPPRLAVGRRRRQQGAGARGLPRLRPTGWPRPGAEESR